MLKSLGNDDLRSMATMLKTELMDRHKGEDPDLVFKKLLAEFHAKQSSKRSSKTRRDTPPIAIAVVMGILTLVVVILTAMWMNRDAPMPQHKELHDSDGDSSMTGSTDREVRTRLENFEQRIQEYNRTAGGEGNEASSATSSSPTGGDIGEHSGERASSSTKPNWMTK